MSYNDICKYAFYHAIGNIVGLFVGGLFILMIVVLLGALSNRAMEILNKKDKK